ncbi:MAG TPA: hypothetical protein PKN86_02210 [Candidatus Obscuribacter sp.]|nr:hypothetical protein [Candidatus Obscuribacter sp.]MBK9280854.1 hypothetical protein [Candidatus Obscuribacter sp.]HMW91585.1 hypothetical protein [Candidatus Obscuribacter sp.]HMX46489.1 hypothetical protein [Candidatus Obscuribacter sp.]HMY02368.1 hypothetical protein [Candidatus Obscuribacter sp.]
MHFLRITTIEAFDLLEFQKKARETLCPKALFELWEDVCKRYERRQIGEYEFEEMKEAIWPNLRALASLRRAMDEVDLPGTGDESKRSA